MLDVISPFFSIIVPVYNAKDYLSRCIESCVKQSFKNIEILIIDDCGTDNSIDEIQQYIQSDNRITVVKNPHNLGLFHTRLEGFKLARGRFCLCLDADDYLHPAICEKLVAFLLKDPEIDMLHFAFERTPRYFLEPKSFHPPHSGYMHQPTIQTFLNLSNTFQTIWGKAIKTTIIQSIIHEVSFIQPPLNSLEDGIFNLLLSFKIKKYYGLNEIGYFYQKNPSSITRSRSYLTFRKRCHDFQKVLFALDIFEKKYQHEKVLINQYRLKILSAYFLEVRFFNLISLLRIIKITGSKISPPPPSRSFKIYLSFGHLALYL